MDGGTERTNKDLAGIEKDKTSGIAAGMGLGDVGGSEKSI